MEYQEHLPVVEKYGVAMSVFFVMMMLNLFLLAIIFSVVYRNGKQIYWNTNILDKNGKQIFYNTEKINEIRFIDTDAP